MYQGHPPPFNGAYCGPVVPPQQPDYKRWHGCCTWNALIKLVVAFLVALGLTVLVLWLVLRPNELKARVEDASLTQFNLTSPNNNLYYNLSLSVSLRNPNKKIGIYYDWLEADAFYYGWRFGYIPLPTFYQGHKNTTMVSPVFVGQSVIGNESSDFVTNYDSKKVSDRFYIDVWIFAQIRFKIGSIKMRRYTTWIKCGLGLPLVVNGTSNGGFRATDCDVDF